MMRKTKLTGLIILLLLSFASTLWSQSNPVQYPGTAPLNAALANQTVGEQR